MRFKVGALEDESRARQMSSQLLSERSNQTPISMVATIGLQARDTCVTTVNQVIGSMDKSTGKAVLRLCEDYQGARGFLLA